MSKTVKCCGNGSKFNINDLRFNLQRNFMNAKLFNIKTLFSLRRVPDVNVQDDSGYTPLHHACLHGHKEIVRLLLSSDASPCIADKQGATPLHLAAFKGDTEIVSMLLAHDNPPVNIDHRTAKHETPLLIAAHFGFTDIVAKLIEKGADVTIRNIHNESALDLAAQFGKLKTVQHLLYVNPHLVDQYKPPMSRTKVFPMTPLNLASKNGHKEVVSALLEAGFDPNVRSYEGTPLHEAARFYRASVVRILLEHGADLRIKDRRGNTVYDLLADNSEKATKRVRKVIREYENKIVSTFDSDEDLPPFPVHECSPTPTGSGRRRWDETEGTSEGDALSVSSAASSCAPLHLAYHNEYNKVSPTPPKKPPRRNLSVSPTHANSPSSGYSYELRPHARSQDDLDDIQSAKQYLKLGRSVDHYVDGKLSYVEYEENQNSSPRIAPVPHPRPSLKQRTQPVAITAMYENVVIKEQNPRRKLRRNSFVSASESIEIRMNDNRTRKYSNQERSSLESLLDNQSMNSPSNLDGYCDAPKIGAPLSPTHYDQPPTPDHPPPSAKQAEKSIHEKIRPLSQLIMEVVEEIRIRKKSQGDVTNS